MSWMALATGLGALGSIWGGNKARKAQANKRRNDMKLAEQYGIHPLSAWGTAGSAMGDGGYGMMASGFDQLAKSGAARAEQRRQEKREEDLMDRQLYSQMWMASKDAQIRRELEERLLGHPITPPEKPSAVKSIGKGIDAVDEYLGEPKDIPYFGVVPEVWERMLNWNKQ